MEKEVGIANPNSADVMKRYASDYLKRPDVQQLIKDTVDSMMKPDDYRKKALNSLSRSAHLLAYADSQCETLSDEELL